MDIQLYQVREAFRKLQASTYYENNNLSLRNQLAHFISKNKDSIDENLELICNKINNGDTFSEELRKIDLKYYPKKITPKDEPDFPQNFISNNFIDTKLIVNRTAIFSEIGIELQLIAILWLMEYGYYLDKNLMNNCMGNRLIYTKDQTKIVSGKSLFKPYMKQYQNWWSEAIKKAQQLFDDKSDVTIVNFDLQDYYHSIQLNFGKIESDIKQLSGNDISTDKLHLIFKEIHKAYYHKISEIEDPRFNLKEGQYPLPIGLLSSPILGNWYLNDFDKHIENEIRPLYYARYVDDIIIVLKDGLIKKNNKQIKVEIENYFNLEIENVESLKIDDNEYANVVNLLIKNIFPKTFQPFIDESTITNKCNEVVYQINFKIKIEKLEELRLQKEKIFIYQFNHKFSPNLINKFVEEQKERSSEFRFLSDEEDESFNDFEANTFESNFDNIDGNKAKFKVIEDNKFKLSVFLAKLIKRRIQKGKGYKEDEILKIDKFFQGHYCIKYYYFWEKLFTLYLVSQKKALFFDLRDRIKNQIKQIEGSDLINSNLRDSLNEHLENSIRMALGLNPTFIDDKRHKAEIEKIKDLYIFRKSSLLRRQYVYYPLTQLSSITNYSSLISSKFNDENLDILYTDYIPYDVKFWEACYFVFIRMLVKKTNKVDDKIFKIWEGDYASFSTNAILDEAFDLFMEINDKHLDGVEKEEYRNKYYICYPDKEISNKKLDIDELHLINSEKHLKAKNEKSLYLRLGIINKYVNFNEYKDSLLIKRKLNPEMVNSFHNILDNVEKLSECDLFVQPELSLPHAIIPEYLSFSAKKQKGIITGVEYITLHNIGFNFVLTCLPINIDGIRDAVPVFRLKNHYSPDEEQFIRDNHMVVPKLKDDSEIFKYRYDLFVWKGVYFSTYYCFELANVIHRTALFSKVDAIFAPLWNKDIFYYNNIAESTVRDLHCYFIQVNTSQYGESRVLRPTDHVRMDKARVKGGTTEGNPVSVLVSDIDIYALRDFQSVDYSAQKERNSEKKSFKPTPPDFNKEFLKKRVENKSFED